MNEDVDYDECAERIRAMLEKDVVDKFVYFFRSSDIMLFKMREKAREFMWRGDIDDLLDVIVGKYYELIKPTEDDQKFKIRFNVPYWGGGSELMNETRLKNLINIMNTVVPDGRNLNLKEVVFDWIEDLVCDTENLTKRYLLHHRYSLFKAAYTILEFDEFLSSNKTRALSGPLYFDIFFAWGCAVAQFDSFLEFDLEHKYDAYHSIGQAFIQKYGAHYIQFMGDYKKALKMALTKWKDGDPSDHAEMATFLVNRPEFAHLKKNKVLEILKPFAKRRKKLRGVKKETKKIETKE